MAQYLVTTTTILYCTLLYWCLKNATLALDKDFFNFHTQIEKPMCF